MSRQINLYAASFRKKADLLSSSNLVLAALLCVLVVVVGAGIARWSLATRMQEARAVSAELTSARDVFAEMTRVVASRKADPQLLAEVASMQRRLTAAQRAETLLLEATAEAGGARVGDMMLSFSRARMDGLWLTGFSVSDGGSALDIRGRMADQALLPKYLRRLENEPVFRGRHFSALEMRGSEWVPTPAVGTAAPAVAEKKEGPWYVEFSLRTVDTPDESASGGKK